MSSPSKKKICPHISKGSYIQIVKNKIMRMNNEYYNSIVSVHLSVRDSMVSGT